MYTPALFRVSRLTSHGPTQRGNLGTRLRKLDDPNSSYTALILASAGLLRLNMGHRITSSVASPTLYHAVGQGAIGVEIREGDERARAIIGSLECWKTSWRTRAERMMLRVLEGGCSVPVGCETKLTEVFVKGGEGDTLPSSSPKKVDTHGLIVEKDGPPVAVSPEQVSDFVKKNANGRAVTNANGIAIAEPDDTQGIPDGHPAVNPAAVCPVTGKTLPAAPISPRLAKKDLFPLPSLHNCTHRPGLHPSCPSSTSLTHHATLTLTGTITSLSGTRAVFCTLARRVHSVIDCEQLGADVAKELVEGGGKEILTELGRHVKGEYRLPLLSPRACAACLKADHGTPVSHRGRHLHLARRPSHPPHRPGRLRHRLVLLDPHHRPRRTLFSSRHLRALEEPSLASDCVQGGRGLSPACWVVGRLAKCGTAALFLVFLRTTRHSHALTLVCSLFLLKDRRREQQDDSTPRHLVVGRREDCSRGSSVVLAVLLSVSGAFANEAACRGRAPSFLSSASPFSPKSVGWLATAQAYFTDSRSTTHAYPTPTNPVTSESRSPTSLRSHPALPLTSPALHAVVAPPALSNFSKHYPLTLLVRDELPADATTAAQARSGLARVVLLQDLLAYEYRMCEGSESRGEPALPIQRFSECCEADLLEE